MPFAMLLKMMSFLLLLLMVSIIQAQEYDVLILGAGFSGLGAAQYLYKQNETNFLVLEATDYKGGRAKNKLFNGLSLALGAAWLHSWSEEHELVKLAKKYNLEKKVDDYDLTRNTIRNGTTGQLINSKLVKGRVKKLHDALNVMEISMEKRMSQGKYDVSLSTGLRWSGYKKKDSLDEAIEFFTFDFENGIDPVHISALQFGMTNPVPGEDFLVTDKRGYSYGVLEESKPFDKKILLNKEVTLVEKSNNEYKVYTADNSIYTAKHVLTTFSSGVLNSRMIKFSPELPDWKYEALAMAPMAHYCRIFLSFNTTFWDKTNYILLATEDRGQYMHWQNFENYSGKKMLLATLAGEICRKTHQVDDNEIKKEAYAVLKKIYKNAVEPIDIMRNDWSTNKYFQGAYSAMVPGITDDDFLGLEHPVRQSLWFSGEYTNGDEYGYAHGAYYTGMKTAKKIIQCIREDLCPPVTPPFSFQAKKDTNVGSLFLPSTLSLVVGTILSIITNIVI